MQPWLLSLGSLREIMIGMHWACQFVIQRPLNQRQSQAENLAGAGSHTAPPAQPVCTASLGALTKRSAYITTA